MSRTAYKIECVIPVRFHCVTNADVGDFRDVGDVRAHKHLFSLGMRNPQRLEMRCDAIACEIAGFGPACAARACEYRSSLHEW